MTVQIAPPPVHAQQVNPFTARPVEVREPAAKTVTRNAVGSSRETQEQREDRNNRAEGTENSRHADEGRQVRAVTRGGRGTNVDIEA
jgi:hypothetical protein